MLAKYLVFGIVPLVIPPIPPDIPIPTREIPSHLGGTDRGYIQRLAREAGYVFYVEPGPLPLPKHRLLRTGRAHSGAAAGAEHQHGCAYKC